ncbi:MAG: hypothetical protein NC231_11640 [Bacillus sp. (in: Bacteria)]|nr:hypothetical protein [Bacillus sp. (in: firmicutes)]MCM1425194.1 hypothetical protein [Eubacterium sp.]
MDERETYQQEYEQQISEPPRKNGKRIFLIMFLILLLAAGAAAATLIFYDSSSKGYEDYTVQKEQYYVEYSEEYDYWDVLTVEYPQISGIDEEVQTPLNQLLYDTAMDRVIYWHLEPSDEVKAFQEEHFSIFASDVNCEVTYHSQYLMSVDYREYYSAGNPVWMTNGTERALTVDLLTGQSYRLEDIIEINRDFIILWDKLLSDEENTEYADDENIDFVLSWFLQSDEEINENYFCRPYFYITEDKDFVIGIALDPVLDYAITYEPLNRSIYTRFSVEELEAFKKQSDFWEKYEKSESVGEVLPCENKAENIWLGEQASVWGWDYD